MMTKQIIPTHQCKICGALWKLLENGEGHPDVRKSWSLVFPSECGKCCDNVEMGKQIVPFDRHSVSGGLYIDNDNKRGWHVLVDTEMRHFKYMDQAEAACNCLKQVSAYLEHWAFSDNHRIADLESELAGMHTAYADMEREFANTQAVLGELVEAVEFKQKLPHSNEAYFCLDRAMAAARERL